MRTASAVVVSFTLLSGAAVSAQQAAAPTASAVAHKTFVLTGCLAADSSGAATAFELRDASAVGQAPPPGAQNAPVGTAGQKVTYKLKPEASIAEAGLSESQLRTYVGQRVQVTVRDADPVASAPPPADRPAAAPAHAEPPAPVQLSPTEIKRVDGTCN